MQNVIATLPQPQLYKSSEILYADNISLWRQISDALHQSIFRVIAVLLAILPGIVACILIVGISGLIGMGVSWMLRCLLTMIKFDDRYKRCRGNDEWVPAGSPTALIGRLSFWICVLMGLVIGISAFDASYASAAILPSAILPYLARIVGAVLLLIAGTLIARYLARTVLIGAVNAQIEYARFLSLGVKWLMLVLTAAIALDHLQIGSNVVVLAFGILFSGIVLTLALAIGLGSRELVSRSLEGHGEGNSVSGPAPPINDVGDAIWHF